MWAMYSLWSLSINEESFMTTTDDVVSRNSRLFGLLTRLKDTLMSNSKKQLHLTSTSKLQSRNYTDIEVWFLSCLNSCKDVSLLQQRSMRRTSSIV